MSKTFLKKIEGIAIFVDESGKFSASVGGKDVSKRNLRDLEKEIDALAAPVIAYEMKYNGPQKVEVIRYEKDRPRMKDGSLDRSYERLFLMDLEALSKAAEIVERKRAIEDEWTNFVNSLPRLTYKNFSEVRELQSKK